MWLGHYNTFHSPDPTLRLPSTNLLSSCIVPITRHWFLTKRLLRYLRGTLGHGLLLCRDTPMLLHAFSDADWAGNQDDCTSTSAYVMVLGSNAVSWCSRKERSVA